MRHLSGIIEAALRASNGRLEKLTEAKCRLRRIFDHNG
jgi:hypothetical protein